MTKTIFKVKNMNCASCAMIIESDLEDAGITAKCSYAKETLEIEHDGEIDHQKIHQIVKSSGYELATN